MRNTLSYMGEMFVVIIYFSYNEKYSFMYKRNKYCNYISFYIITIKYCNYTSSCIMKIHFHV